MLPQIEAMEAKLQCVAQSLPQMVEKAENASKAVSAAKSKADGRTRCKDTKSAKDFKSKGVSNCLANLGSRMLQAVAATENSALLTITEGQWDPNAFAYYGKFEAVSGLCAIIEESVTVAIKIRAKLSVVKLRRKIDRKSWNRKD